MSDYDRLPGKTTVAPGVLLVIARKAALGVTGVQAVGTPASLRGRSVRGRDPGGVKLVIHDDVVSGDIFLVIRAGVNIRDVCREVQQQVARALAEMAGMQVARMDIHVEDIEYEGIEA